MTERAAHLVDHVFPDVPVRQWVLSLPHRVRYVLAWDHDLCRAVVAVSMRAVLGFLRHRACEAGVGDPRGGASVEGRVALGPRSGRRVRRRGDPPEEAESGGPRPCHARQDGFDLHAVVRIRAGCRDRLERVIRYALRPPIAADRLRLTPEGQVLLALKRRWADGTTHLVFDPTELLERLAAIKPTARRCQRSARRRTLALDLSLGAPDAAEFRLRRPRLRAVRRTDAPGRAHRPAACDPTHSRPSWVSHGGSRATVRTRPAATGSRGPEPHARAQRPFRIRRLTQERPRSLRPACA